MVTGTCGSLERISGTANRQSCSQQASTGIFTDNNSWGETMSKPSLIHGQTLTFAVIWTANTLPVTRGSNDFKQRGRNFFFCHPHWSCWLNSFNIYKCVMFISCSIPCWHDPYCLYTDKETIFMRLLGRMWGGVRRSWHGKRSVFEFVRHKQWHQQRSVCYCFPAGLYPPFLMCSVHGTNGQSFIVRGHWNPCIVR